jgi:hypothetical protein
MFSSRADRRRPESQAKSTAAGYRDPPYVPTGRKLRADDAYRQTYNRSWIIEQHGYRTPAQVRADQTDPTLMAA